MVPKGPKGIVEDECQGDLDLAHAQLPEIARPPVSGGERGGAPRVHGFGR